MKVAVAFDHRGVKLRERILAELEALGHEAHDLGTDRPEPRIDYPDKAREVGEAIRGGDAERAVFVCGSGVGASGEQDRRDPRGGLPRHVLGAPGR
jgi:ribose 5-phosphate isomerase B